MLQKWIHNFIISMHKEIVQQKWKQTFWLVNIFPFELATKKSCHFFLFEEGWERASIKFLINLGLIIYNKAFIG